MHTFKVQAIIDSKTQQILILCISKGAVHNFELFKRNLHLIPTNSFTLADRGYQGIYALYSDGLLPSKFKNLSTLKPFKILAERYLNKEKRLGLRFNWIAGISNL